MNVVGDIVEADRVRLRIKRGESLLVEFSPFEDDGAACTAPVKGSPINLQGFSLQGFGEISGEIVAEGPIARSVALTVIPITLGTATSPALVRVYAPPVQVAKVFQEGAFQEFTVQVIATRGNESLTIFGARVTVEDAASGVGL